MHTKALTISLLLTRRTYALRACSRALLAGLMPALAFTFTGGWWWRSLGADGGPGTSRDTAMSAGAKGMKLGMGVFRAAGVSRFWLRIHRFIVVTVVVQPHAPQLT